MNGLMPILYRLKDQALLSPDTHLQALLDILLIYFRICKSSEIANHFLFNPYIFDWFKFAYFYDVVTDG